MKLKNKIGLWILLPLIGLSIIAFRSDDRYFEIVRNLNIFASLYKEVNQYYVEDVNPNTLLKTGIDAMLKKLDPYTNYIAEDDIEDYRTMATGEYSGIGIQSNKLYGKHIVLLVYEESPASEAGLRIADELITIDGIDITNKSNDEVGKLMKGQSGSDIEVGIKRQYSSEMLTLKMKRHKIIIPNISYKGMLTDDIGYFKLNEFTRNAGNDVRETVKELKEKGSTKIIFDLRDNPGGLLNEAVNICNVFLPKDIKIVNTKARLKNQNHTYNTLKEPLDLSIPLAILINSQSASASEVVSGVLQDYDRGVLIGQKSYGKGLVQQTKKLSHNAQLKVTIAKYYIPSGRSIQVLDYSNKRADGSVGKIPDSLKSAFKTSNGRIVFDGGGIDPDILVKKNKFSSYTSNLSQSGLIFEYVSKYYHEHDKIAPAKDFVFTAEEYNEFLSWMETKDFENNSLLEKSFLDLEVAIEKDKIYKSITTEIEDVKKAIEKVKSNELIKFKNEIMFLITQEIVTRYYFTKGLIENSLGQDADIKAAIDILQNKGKYQYILKG